jgi:hypothetical protein
MKSMSVKNRWIAFLLSIAIIFSLCPLAIMGEAAAGNSQAGAEPAQWKSIIFGQSISDGRNSVSVDRANGTVTLTAGSKDGSSAGGKITGSHDGISYYYTEIDSSQNFELSAKVTVNFFAKSNPDNQEGFGIMARDAIVRSLDPTVFASNMVMVGGYRGAMRSVFRDNVQDVSGAGAVMEDVFTFGERPANDGSATYRLKLRKTNTGYQVTVDNAPEKIYYRPKQLEVLDPDRIYVGFFTARVASITVSEIAFQTSEVATDPPGRPEPPKPFAPSINIVSPSRASLSSYHLTVSTNVKGNLEIKQEGTPIFNGPVEKAGTFERNATLVPGKNTFDLSFTPDSTANITTAAPLRLTHTVTYKTYGKAGGAIYVAPTGRPTSSAAKSDPIDIYSAVQFLQPGQTIYVRGGVYHLTAPVVIERGNEGVSGKLKALTAYPGERPIFDFDQNSSGFILDGDYWKISGIDITRSNTHGFRISGNYNRIELVNTYANGDSGLQISAAPGGKPDQWPSHNLILDCTAYDNRDPSENNADGFAAKLTCGPGNVFRGCISHNNCDDGWDLYSKLENGPISPVTVENCIAYDNGRLSDGTNTKGDGNGFKMGGEGLAVQHVLRNSLAFRNRSDGITSNSDPAIIVENNTSVDNGKANFDFSHYANASPQFVAKHNISFRTAAGKADFIPAFLATDDNYFFNGTVSVNAGGKQVSAADFKSVTPAPFLRKKDGAIRSNDYMALTSKSSIKGGAVLDDFSNITNPSKKEP